MVEAKKYQKRCKYRILLINVIYLILCIKVIIEQRTRLLDDANPMDIVENNVVPRSHEE